MKTMWQQTFGRYFKDEDYIDAQITQVDEGWQVYAVSPFAGCSRIYTFKEKEKVIAWCEEHGFTVYVE